MKDKLYNHSSGIQDTGVFTKRRINKGELILVICGTTENHDYSYSDEGSRHWYQIGDGLWINPEGFERYVNHSCNPNSGIFNLTEMRALKDIMPSKEIVFDYDTSDWDESESELIVCSCKNKNCRKIIKGYKFLPEELKKRYQKLDLIPKFLIDLDKNKKH